MSFYSWAAWISLLVSKQLIWVLACACFPVIPPCGILVSKAGNHSAELEGGYATLTNTETLISFEIFCWALMPTFYLPSKHRWMGICFANSLRCVGIHVPDPCWSSQRLLPLERCQVHRWKEDNLTPSYYFITLIDKISFMKNETYYCLFGAKNRIA